MNQRVRQCARLARVRTIQHGLAAAVAERAVRQVESLETSAGKLALLRSGFGTEEGMVSGAALASLGEIAMRLDVAREGLTRSLQRARAQATVCRDKRIVARRDQESADRLTGNAAREAARRADRKHMPRSVIRKRLDDDRE